MLKVAIYYLNMHKGNMAAGWAVVGLASLPCCTAFCTATT